MTSNALKDTTFVFQPLGLSEDQAYALLTDDAAGVLFPPQGPGEGTGVGLITASANPKAHTGAMVALVPSQEDLERLAVEGGEPLEELHLTLAYLGEADQISEELQAQIIQTCMKYFTSPVHTEAFSINVFNPHTDLTETAVVLGIRGEDLVEPRGNIMSAVRGAYAGMPENHNPWIPHVTLKYTSDLRKEKPDAYVGRLGAITFDTLRFAFAGEVTDIPLYDEPMTAAVSRMPRQLKKYWLGPEGSARVGGWGSKGSFGRCQAAMREEGVDADQIDGLCANLYRSATGHNPGRKKQEASLDDLLTAGVSISTSDEVEELEVSEDEVPTLVEWDGILTLEGVESGDGRMFKYGSLDWAPLPLKLMYQPSNSGGHSNSVLVGQITHVYRDGNAIMGRGIIDLAAKTADGFEVGREVFRLMDERYLNGVSVDVDKVKDADVEHIYATENPGPFDKPTGTVFNRGRIRGATIVAFPAFVEAAIHLTGDVLTASAVGEVLTMTDCGCDGTPLTAASHTITIPDVPPAWWFSEPTDVEMKGALTITDEGRVYGQLAPKGVTHRSVKRQVPNRVDYTRFMGAETIVAGADGNTHRVVTGPITFNCGHASTDQEVFGTLENRRKHYDNSCSVFADIAIGEDRDGNVWVAGAVKPYASGEQIQQAMSCRLSGDWQPHPDKPGVNEFIAALLVPVPGFATARTEASVTVRDGALVASVIPVEFAETALLTAAYRKKEIYRKRIGSFAERHKIEMAKRLGRGSADV